MSDIQILLIGLVMYVLGNLYGYYTNNKMLNGVSAILWFIPIYLVDNIIIQTFSVVMLIVSIIIIFGGRENENF